MKLIDWFQRSFKNLDDLGTAFMAGAIVLAGLGGFVHVNPLVDLGLASFGGAVVTWGAGGMQRGDMPLLARGFRLTERVELLLSRIWGFVFVLVGFWFMGYGILSIFNPRSPFPPAIQGFFETPQGSSVFWLIGSSVGILFAITLLFADDSEGNNRVTRFLSNLYARLVGMVLLIVFSLLALFNVLKIVSPPAVDTLLEFLLRLLGLG